MELTNEQYQRLCNVANLPHDDPSINELISAFQLQRINLIACGYTLEECRAELAALKAERQWIPVSERLPENHRDVLLLTAYDEPHLGWYSTKRGMFRRYGSTHDIDGVTHWAEIPPAPDNQQHKES